MSKNTSIVKRLVEEEEAGTAVEYGLITAVIAVALIVALVAFKGRTHRHVRPRRRFGPRLHLIPYRAPLEDLCP